MERLDLKDELPEKSQLLSFYHLCANDSPIWVCDWDFLYLDIQKALKFNMSKTKFISPHPFSSDILSSFGSTTIHPIML